MKTPEEMAYDYGEKFDGVEISKNDINIAWYEGYEAAQEHAHAALEEAEAKIQELQDQLADADKVMPDTCEHILDMSKMVDVNGWISVKDRMPELWNDYLAFGYGPTIPASCFVAVYDPKSNKWYDMHTDWDWSDVITHWQELPEPPKEEK